MEGLLHHLANFPSKNRLRIRADAHDITIRDVSLFSPPNCTVLPPLEPAKDPIARLIHKLLSSEKLMGEITDSDYPTAEMCKEVLAQLWVASRTMKSGLE